MVTKAILRYIRITPRKFRLIIPLVKGKNPEEAIAVLMSVKKGASKYAIDLLKSAIANAKRIQGVEVSDLYISKFIADGGPMLKRYRAASMGRAGQIRKRTSHITVELDAVKRAEEKTDKAKPERQAHAHPHVKEPAKAKGHGTKEEKYVHEDHAKKHKAKEPAKHGHTKKVKE